MYTSCSNNQLSQELHAKDEQMKAEYIARWDDKVLPLM